MAEERHDWLEPAIRLAQGAGRALLELYQTDLAVTLKEDQTPVPEADYLAHDILVEGLRREIADLPVISEEDPVPPLAERQHWQEYWLVDPLDGTREFIAQRDGFSVNIALVHDNEPVLGIIYVPVSGACYYACRGHGAFRRRNGSAQDRLLQTRRPHAQPPVVAVTRSRHGHRLANYLRQLGEHETVSIGSSIKSCMVAEGKADLYPCLGPTSEWDTAAAQCIVQEAGGFMTDMQGDPLRYNTRDHVINPPFIAYGDPDVAWARYHRE